MSNTLDPDQARHFEGPGLGLICLQRLSAGMETNDVSQINALKHWAIITIRSMTDDIANKCFII